MDTTIFVSVMALVLVVIVVIAKSAVIVPQQSAYVVESLGKYSRTLHAGFHILIPFLEKAAYRHSLKEQATDIPEQVCITNDNVQVGVDGVLYLQVISELDKASDPWGIKVLRYEIKNITPPKDVLAAMEKQMRAEREKRAVILTSEGERDAAINQAEGEKQQVIKASEAAKQKQINESAGEAAAILAVAGATADGLRKVAEATQVPGGYEAVQLRVAEDYIERFGKLAQETNTLVLPANVADVGSMLALAMNIIKKRVPGEDRGTA